MSLKQRILTACGIAAAMAVLFLTVWAMPEAAKSARAQQTASVTLTDTANEPRTITVTVGTTVVWTNAASERSHTVTSETGVFGSQTVRIGQTFQFTFSQAGTFPYYCRFHGGPGGEGVSGTVVVAQTAPGRAPAGGVGALQPGNSSGITVWWYAAAIAVGISLLALGGVAIFSYKRR